MKNKTIIICLMIGCIGIIPVQAQENPDTAKFAEKLDFANGLFQREMHSLATNEYKALIEQFPKQEGIEGAYFGLGESYFFSNEYVECVKSHLKYLELFPEGDKKQIATLRVGQSQFFREKHDEAIKHLTAVAPDQLEPNFRQILYFYLGKTYRALEDNANAIAFLEKVTRVEEKTIHSTHAYLEIADLYSKEPNYEKTIEYFDKAYNNAQEAGIKSSSLYKQGEMQFSTGHYGKAVDVFRKVIKEFPKQEVAKEAVANLIVALYKTDRFEEVIKDYQTHAELLGQKEQFFSVYILVASTYGQLNKYDQALELLAKVLQIAELKPEQKDKANLRKSEYLLKTGKNKEVVALIDSQLAQAKTDIDQILFYKAEALYADERYNQALLAYEHVVNEFKESPFWSDSLYGSAHTQNALGKNKEAQTLFGQYYQTGTDDKKKSEALYNEILLSKKLADIPLAIAKCELYLAKFKDIEIERVKKVLFLLGTLYAQDNNYDQAVSTFQKYIEQYADSDKLQEAYFLLGYNLQMAEQYDEALKYYSKISADQADPKLQYSTLKNQALIAISKDDHELAAKLFEQIVNQHPENDLEIQTYIWLVQYYIKNKKFDQSLNALAKLSQQKKTEEYKGQVAFYKAETYRELNEYEKAVANYDVVFQAAQEGEYLAATHIGKGLSLLAMKDYATARTEFDKVLLDYSEDTTIAMRARYEIANIERLSNNLEEASKYYMLVAVLYNDTFYSPQSLYEAAQIFESLEKKDDALKAYGEIIESYQDSHVVEQAKKRIEVLSAS